MASKYFARLFTFLLSRSSDHIVAIAEPVGDAHVANGLNQSFVSVIHNLQVALFRGIK